MNYFKYLKGSFPLYLISGTLLAIAVFSLAIVHRYNGYLRNSLDTLNTINRKERDIRDQITQADLMITDLRKDFGIREDKVDTEMLIFRALDDLKLHLVQASIVVSRFEEAEGKRQLPVEIKLPVSNYGMVIDSVGYIESFRLPDFKIKNLALLKEQSGPVVLNVQGAFVVPMMGSQL